MTASARSPPPAPDLSELCHSLIERSPAPMAGLEGAGHIVRCVNPAFCRLVGKSSEALVGFPFAETVQEGDGCLAVLDRVYCAGEAETHAEQEHLEHHPVYWSYAVWPVLGADRRPVGVMMQVTETTRFHREVGAMNEALLVSSVHQHELTEAAEGLNAQLEAEIAERKRHEERQKMLVNELTHRVKNTLATVQSIAVQTMLNAKTMEGFRDAFEARLDALAKTHNLLTQNPSQVVTLRDLAVSELSHYAAADAFRYAIEGEDVPLPSNRAVPIGMMFHELATNAAKYGALSAPAGRVKVSWTVDRERQHLHLEWIETGGPAVGKPTRRGFGSRLLERGLAHELDATVHLNFDAAGVHCTIDLPLPSTVVAA
ncbi:MAG TPA: HWE histidine kinase domain-containing protein [Stellaceae bacterium]|nr:HWE histidine kinase domain-containing protein [Stellaceae bacterium]